MPPPDLDRRKVTVKTAGNEVKRIEIKIRNGRFSFTYQPTTDVEDQATVYKGRISGSEVTGTFESGDLCVNEGRFTAKR